MKRPKNYIPKIPNFIFSYYLEYYLEHYLDKPQNPRQPNPMDNKTFHEHFGKPSGGHWIQGAIKHPGALHAELGVPQGQKIPKSKLDKAAHAGGKLGQRARFAETLSKFR